MGRRSNYTENASKSDGHSRIQREWRSETVLMLVVSTVLYTFLPKIDKVKKYFHQPIVCVLNAL